MKWAFRDVKNMLKVSWSPRSNKYRSGKIAFLTPPVLVVSKVRPVGYDGNNPTSVAEWLESLELGDYTKSFLVNGYTSMELVKKIWEIELINVSFTAFSTSCFDMQFCKYIPLLAVPNLMKDLSIIQRNDNSPTATNNWLSLWLWSSPFVTLQTSTTQFVLSLT